MQIVYQIALTFPLDTPNNIDTIMERVSNWHKAGPDHGLSCTGKHNLVNDKILTTNGILLKIALSLIVLIIHHFCVNMEWDDFNYPKV